MEYKTTYGTIRIGIEEDGKIVVESSIPFKKVREEFENVKEAQEFFKKLKEEVEEIIREMEEMKKKVTAESSTLYKQLYKYLTMNFRRILLYGPTGTGKTFTAIQVLKRLKEEKKIDDFLVITFSSGMEDIDLLGKFIPDESKVIKYNPSELVAFFEKNKDKKIAVIFDEFNRASSKTLNILIPLLDERDGKVVLENFIANKKVILPAENVIFIFTANFGASYTGTFQLDDAILNRIELAIFCDYQQEIEDAIIAELDDEKREIARKIRDFFREAYKQGLVNPFSTRDVKTLVKLLKPLSDITVESVFNAVLPLLYKIVKIDPQGYPDAEFIEDFKKFLKEEVIK